MYFRNLLLLALELLFLWSTRLVYPSSLSLWGSLSLWPGFGRPCQLTPRAGVCVRTALWLRALKSMTSNLPCPPSSQQLLPSSWCDGRNSFTTKECYSGSLTHLLINNIIPNHNHSPFWSPCFKSLHFSVVSLTTRQTRCSCPTSHPTPQLCTSRNGVSAAKEPC